MRPSRSPARRRPSPAQQRPHRSLSGGSSAANERLAVSRLTSRRVTNKQRSTPAPGRHAAASFYGTWSEWQAHTSLVQRPRTTRNFEQVMLVTNACSACFLLTYFCGCIDSRTELLLECALALVKAALEVWHEEFSIDLAAHHVVMLAAVVAGDRYPEYQYLLVHAQVPMIERKGREQSCAKCSGTQFKLFRPPMLHDPTPLQAIHLALAFNYVRKLRLLSSTGAFACVCALLWSLIVGARNTLTLSEAALLISRGDTAGILLLALAVPILLLDLLWISDVIRHRREWYARATATLVLGVVLGIKSAPQTEAPLAQAVWALLSAITLLASLYGGFADYLSIPICVFRST